MTLSIHPIISREERYLSVNIISVVVSAPYVRRHEQMAFYLSASSIQTTTTKEAVGILLLFWAV
jgi:hypothetical protein